MQSGATRARLNQPRHLLAAATVLVLSLSGPAHAQTPAAAPPAAAGLPADPRLLRWDPSIRYGVLPNGLRYAVHLSSCGAQVPEGTGPIAGLHSSEQKLNAISGLNVVHLRAAVGPEAPHDRGARRRRLRRDSASWNWIFPANKPASCLASCR